MKNKKLKSESHGTQQQTWAGGAGAGSNFQHGKDLGTHTRGSLGTRGGDSNFSRRTQRIMPIDYFDARHAAESDKDCDGEDWATGYCPGEELDEDYVVENSKYSLVEVVGLLEQVLDMEPDDDGLFSFTGEMFDVTDITTTNRTASYYGLELGFETIESIAKYIPGVSQGIDISSLIFNMVTLHRSASKILDLDKKFEKELKTLTFEKMLEDREKYIRLFIEGIKEVEELQAGMYDDFGDGFQSLFSIIPYEEALAGMTGGPGYIVKILDTLLEVGFGVAIEKAVRSFVESYEVNYDEKSELDDIVMDQKNFEDWLRRNEDSTTKGMKMMLVMLRLLQGPFPALLNPGTSAIRSFRALFVGAKIQNKLLKLINQLKNPELLGPDAPTDKEEFDSNVMPDEESEELDQSDSSGPSEFFRKLFFKESGDQGNFKESLDSQSLLYLIETVDSELDEDIDSELDEDDMNEFSGAGGAGGVSLPLGMSTKGPKGNTSANSGGAAWPYSKKQQAAFKKYSKKSFGGK